MNFKCDNNSMSLNPFNNYIQSIRKLNHFPFVLTGGIQKFKTLPLLLTREMNLRVFFIIFFFRANSGAGIRVTSGFLPEKWLSFNEYSRCKSINMLNPDIKLTFSPHSPTQDKTTYIALLSFFPCTRDQ